MPQRLPLITRWIDEGAKFDGQNPAAPFSSAAPSPAEGPRAKKPGVVQATGKESRFARDVGPAYRGHCLGCHNTRNRRPRWCWIRLPHCWTGAKADRCLCRQA